MVDPIFFFCNSAVFTVVLWSKEAFKMDDFQKEQKKKKNGGHAGREECNLKKKIKKPQQLKNAQTKFNQTEQK